MVPGEQGRNGYTFEPSQSHMTEVLIKMHFMAETELRSLGEQSLQIIKKYSLERYAKAVIESIRFSHNYRNQPSIWARLSLLIAIKRNK